MLWVAAQTPNYRAQKLITARQREPLHARRGTARLTPPLSLCGELFIKYSHLPHSLCILRIIMTIMLK